VYLVDAAPPFRAQRPTPAGLRGYGMRHRRHGATDAVRLGLAADPRGDFDAGDAGRGATATGHAATGADSTSAPVAAAALVRPVSDAVAGPDRDRPVDGAARPDRRDAAAPRGRRGRPRPRTGSGAAIHA
jgi:hypothetical protein